MDIKEQIKCVEREIGCRERVYPRLVESKKMSQEKADKEILAMKKVKSSLEALEGCYEWFENMIEAMNNEHGETNRLLPIGNFEYQIRKLADNIKGNVKKFDEKQYYKDLLGDKTDEYI